MTYNPYVANQQATITQLFETYVNSLATRGAKSTQAVKRILDKVADFVGADTPINHISAEQICEFLAGLYSNNAPAYTAWTRATLRSAWNWGKKSDYDYKSKIGIRFGIKVNPIDSIPSDNAALCASRERYITQMEIPDYLSFLEQHRENPSSAVLLLALLSGSRIEEICNLRVCDFNKEQGTIYFPQTKIGNSHTIALGSWATSILTYWVDGKADNDFIFQSARSSKAITNKTVYRFFIGAKLEGACPRDSRRTFLTLGHAMGLDRGILDMIQNHTDNSNIASKHYDKVKSTPEYLEWCRVALNRWEGFLTGLRKVKMAAYIRGAFLEDGQA